MLNIPIYLFLSNIVQIRIDYLLIKLTVKSFEKICQSHYSTQN